MNRPGGNRSSRSRPQAIDERSGAAGPVLQVSDLGVEFRVGDEWVMASQHVTFDIAPGKVLAVVGESGSGKSVTSMGMLGLLPGNARLSGSAKIRGTELIGAPEPLLRRIRGSEIGLIFQEPMTALNPVLTVGFQVAEVLLSHRDISPTRARERAVELFTLVDLPDPAGRYDLYPHQLSGGQRQRVMIAMAIACDPVLLIADEPTTALDVTVQAEILDLLRDLHHRLDSAILLITHDMGVVADLADDVVVMRHGDIVESGPVREIFARPQVAYTRDLLASVPHLGAEIAAAHVTEADRAVELPARDGVEAMAALTVRNLVLEYPGRGRVPAFRAVDDVSFTVGPGEVLGLVGESGSGKTTIGRAVAGLLPITSGTVAVGGTDLVGLTQKQLRPLRRKVAIVFQDPAASLNPRMSIGESIGEPLYLHEQLRRRALDARVEALLESVRLPHQYRNRYPHELSGGQRQRVSIARALSLGPELLVADEPTSALDVSVQAHVLELFKDLQQQYGFACLFVSHDLAVIEIVAQSVAVLHRGKMAEYGSREDILLNPQDDYTRRLIAAAPVPDPDEQLARRAERARLLAAGADEEPDADTLARGSLFT